MNLDETLIRKQIDNFWESFRTKNIERMMSLYAPEFVAFDIVSPLQEVGAAKYRKVWEKAFTFFRDPIIFEIQDLHISATQDLAFSFQLVRLQTDLISGEQVDRWQRVTCCFRKDDEQWLLVHEHASVPVDLMTGKAALDLQPETLV